MNVIERIQMLKKMVKEAERIVTWQEDIYTALHNIHATWVVSGRFPMTRMPDMEADKIMVGQGAGNSPVEEDKYSDVDVLAVIAARIKGGNVTDTTDAGGEIAVAFASPFTSTPVVIVQLEGDVDYYSVITARNVNGFTVKILKTYHKHSQGNTGNEATHTHSINFASGAGSAHHHSNPNTSSTGSHRHSHSLTSGAEAAHTHSNPNTDGATQGGTGYAFYDSITWVQCPLGHENCAISASTRRPHYHSQSSTGAGSSHTHSITGYSDYAGTHSHTVGNTGDESAHTHSVSGTSGAGSNHSHSNPDTAEVNAGNLLATSEVTFSYIAMLP